MTYDHILLAIGPEDRDSLDALVDATIDLAEPSNASVSLLYAFPRDDYEAVMEQMGIDTTTSGLTPDEVAQRHESVREPADRLESLGIDYEIRGVSGGNLADRVVRTIERSGADVAVVGGTKRSPAGKAMFGDHAQQVLLNAPVPVVYVKRE
ncbi:universal stress protein [Halorubrum lacusprofundi]|jgi:nucleotide-binding universal stress UspA family protein|uniref:universal stress protein n=1 Tax=Halorubrum lacusprofundi TaxID=2247 RepID=UPI000B5A9058|nr:universal stress protein [Halorubrum lacusprofundi]MCG1007569.1 universal stress protein [Halorubrum lacusprofundi]